MRFTDVTGLASLALPITAIALLIPRVASLPKSRLAAVLALVALLTLAPLRGLPLLAYVRSVTGDLSITAAVLACAAIASAVSGWPAIDARNRLALRALIVLVAIALYPMALGIGCFDPYRLGYGQPWFMGSLLLVTLAAWFARLHLLASCIALAVLAWTVGWYESSNLWDYLLDPLVASYALGALILRSKRR